MDAPVHEYEYRAKWWMLILSAVFFSFCTVASAHRASTNDRGLILGGRIELGPTGATVFYWVLFAFGLLAVLCSLVLGYQRLRYRRRIVLGPESIRVPANGWSAVEKQIDYRSIRTVTVMVMPMYAGRVLTITYTGGKADVLSDQTLLTGAVERAKASDRP
jgi:hypothetical protein